MTLKQRDLWLKEKGLEKRVFLADDVDYQAIKAEVSGIYAKIWEREGKGQRLQNNSPAVCVENVLKM